ncbi:MAG: flagellar assembly protein A [Massilia sp.]
MSIDPAVSTAQNAPAGRLEGEGPEHCIIRRDDGVYADPAVLGTTLLAAVDSILLDNCYFSGLDYPVLIKALFGCGPDLPRGPGGAPQVRLAAAILPFDPARRSLYRAVKIADGKAEYYFEPVYLPDPEDPASSGIQARLDVDEFIADMWLKGIRFGIDVAVVRSAIESGQSGRVTVARRLEPAPGQDATVMEISEDIRRNDAPRQLANGKLDLMSFQNRFPQIQLGARLLKKVPRAAGADGFELSGIGIAPEVPKDLELRSYAGPGTSLEVGPEGEFLVAAQAGFLSVDPKTSQISIGDKIVSHDGVSAKTTGNLQLTGDYEEFGEVQENRVIEGESITIHADVFGHVRSRGGAVRLNRNLVGGSAHNKDGDIHVKGVASRALVQAGGAVVLQRAENCIVSGARVTIAHAVNCEILAEDIEIGEAEGCAVAGLRIAIGSAAPRRQGEMVVFAMHPDVGRIDEVMEQVGQRMAEYAALAVQHKAQLEQLTTQPEVRRYLQLATRVRNNEITLTPEQLPQFQKIALAVAPQLTAIAHASSEARAAEAEQQSGQALLAQLERQRADTSAPCMVTIGQVRGEIQVRAEPFHPDGGRIYDLAARDIKARLREAGRGTLLFGGASGAYEWSNQRLA